MGTPPLLLGGRYEIVAPIGSGGMADVYRARDRVLAREVAVKVLRATSDADRERFASEARILALLSHESIVTVYDTGVEDDQPWLALELVEGMTLRDAYGDGRPTADPRILAGIGAQVAAGLAHAHDRGVVHRDVKPANILLTPGDRARLTDFGIARLMDSDAHLTLTGTTIGTAAYLAPEQVRGGPVTGAADVYALGLVLLEALTGHRSYDGTPVEAALARLHHGPLIPTSLPAGWPGLLAAMTASDPADRPPAGAVAARLHTLAGRVPASAITIPPARLDGTPPRRRGWLPVAGIASAVGLVLAATALVVGSDEPTVAGAPGSTPSATTQPSRAPAPTRAPSSSAPALVSQPAPSATPSATHAPRAGHHRPRPARAHGQAGSGARARQARSQAPDRAQGQAQGQARPPQARPQEARPQEEVGTPRRSPPRVSSACRVTDRPSGGMSWVGGHPRAPTRPRPLTGRPREGARQWVTDSEHSCWSSASCWHWPCATASTPSTSPPSAGS